MTLYKSKGRLGDLGRIDDKFDVAISTAGAGGLDSLVVDSRETAEAIFEHLRKHNIGRANVSLSIDSAKSTFHLSKLPAKLDDSSTSSLPKIPSTLLSFFTLFVTLSWRKLGTKLIQSRPAKSMVEDGGSLLSTETSPKRLVQLK